MCEGKVTEPEYFRGFANACSNPRVTLQIAPEAGVPLTVVTLARDRKKAAETRAEDEKDENLKYDSVWAVFDVDDHPNIPAAIQMARDNHIQLAISNLAFELWLLLHFRDHPEMKGRKDVRRLLNKFLKKYDKHIDFDDCQAGYDEAVKRASRLDRCNLQACQHGPNPSTEVYRLTESIRSDSPDPATP